MLRLSPLALAILLIASGCGELEEPQPEAPTTPELSRGDVELALDRSIARIRAYADSIEQALRPEPLLRPNQIAAFNRFRNPQHVARARELGIAQPVTEAAIQEHLDENRLVELSDGEHWILRELDYSSPYVTPDLEAMLTEIGERFHDELAERGLPPLRLEITSVLRSAQDQERLRQVNPNAARGTSSHQFGTTIDIAYSSFVAPLDPNIEFDLGEVDWLEPYLRQMEGLAAETGAARMSRELQAVLGHILREMQNEGKVMVTMEILQPVYHLTVARRY